MRPKGALLRNTDNLKSEQQKTIHKTHKNDV